MLRFQRRVQSVAEHLRKRTADRTALDVLFPLPKDVAQRTGTPASEGIQARNRKVNLSYSILSLQHNLWRFVASEEGAVQDYDAWATDTATAVLNIFTKVLLFVKQSSVSGDDAQMMDTDSEEPVQKRQRASLKQWTETHQLEAGKLMYFLLHFAIFFRHTIAPGSVDVHCGSSCSDRCRTRLVL